MKTQKLTLIIASILLVGIMSGGIVDADRELSSLEGITIDDFTAGTEVTANFSYYYLEIGENVDNSPWILQFNITSQNESYPVWKGDFSMDGYIKRCKYDIGIGNNNASWCLFGSEIIPFSCKELSRTINHSLGSETISGGNGTFYCYNRSADIDLKTKDNVFLNIKSKPALYPGTYNLTAKIYYLNDTYSPIVIIINKEDFENVYYKSGKYVEIKANISDVNLNKEEVMGKIYWGGNEIKLNKNQENNLYYFSTTLADEIPEGNHTLEIFAEDIFGNYATDETRLLIDETAPNITLIEPMGDEVYSEILPVKLNVTDEKAGVNNTSVKIRLREIVNGQICPEIGVPLGNYTCTRTDWINLPYNSSSEFFEEDVNTTELNLTSGEYWLDVKASDILGNENYLQ
jgi:hypothetical protein